MIVQFLESHGSYWCRPLINSPVSSHDQVALLTERSTFATSASPGQDLAQSNFRPRRGVS